MQENPHHLEYNTERPHLIIPEYGRNIKKMIDHAISVEDRELRNKIAQSIITVMGQLNPHLRDITDFTHKLWDHLFIISDFHLDVDSPYPKPTKETFSGKPERINYPKKDIKYLHYGKNVEVMIEKVLSMEEGPEKNAFKEAIANTMKRFYIQWNQETVSDEVIFGHMKVLSKGKLNMENIKLSSSSELSVRPMGTTSGSLGKKKKKQIKPGLQQKKKKF
jgi:hypothetical protein